MSPNPRLAQVLVYLAAAAVIALSAVGVLRRFSAPQPASPWEAAQIGEAWRSATGAPVYEPAATGHATHMYGALAPVTTGALFKLTGPSLQAARAVSLLTALALVFLLLRITMVREPMMIAVGAALMVGIDTLTGGYFAQARPDFPALLLATLGLVALYRATERGHAALFAAGTALILLALFFKQTAAMVALIPPVALIAERRRSALARRVLLSLLPLFAVLVTVLALRWAPLIHHYMIGVPRSYGVAPATIVEDLVALLVAAPLFWVALMRRLTLRGERTTLEAWLLAAAIVTVPLSAYTSAKAGGTSNSWLPGLLALHAYTVYALARAPLSTTAEQVVLALLVGASAPGVHASFGFMPRHRDHAEARAYIATLQGTVATPEDPTLLLPRTPGRSVYLEMDASPQNGNWRASLPCYVWADLLRADYIVDARNWWQDLVRETDLSAAGFTVTWQSPHYQVWRRPGSTPRTPACWAE